MIDFDRFFEHCFQHLGIDVLYQKPGQDPVPIRMLEKVPDLAYTLGDGRITGEVLTGELLYRAAPDPQIGDQIIIGDQSYSIFQQPLRDPSQRTWRVQAIARDHDAQL